LKSAQRICSSLMALMKISERVGILRMHLER
jgi:hypothetical protein